MCRSAKAALSLEFYNNAGFVFFMPIRRGHLPSPGTHRTTLAGLLAEVQDVAAGITYLKSLPVVDRTRIVASGASNGGIMTLLAADQAWVLERQSPLRQARSHGRTLTSETPSLRRRRM